MKTTCGKGMVLAGILAGALTAAAGAGENGSAADGKSGRPRFDHLARELELTPEQTGALQRHMQNQRAKFTELHAARTRAKAELEALFAAADPDAQAIGEAGERLAGINAEITRSQIQARLALRGLLTAEQQARWRRLRQKMMQRQAGKTRTGRQAPNSGGGHPVDPADPSDRTDRSD